MTITVKKEINFKELYAECWSGATYTLNTIEENEKEDELMDFLNEIFQDCEDITTINDFLWFDSDYILECLGIEQE